MRAVIPCVDHADFLAETLPAWRRWLPADAWITVVTAHTDHETQAIAVKYEVDCLVTDVWWQDAAIFNKAAALDAAFGFGMAHRLRGPAENEVCLSLDADVYPCGRARALERLERDVLYGCARYTCDTPADLDAHRLGRTQRSDLALISSRALPDGYAPIANTPQTVAQMAAKCLGYFQLFRYCPGLQFGSWPTASKYDVAFRGRFRQKVGLLEPYVLHLGEQKTGNWEGRCVAPWPVEAH